MLLEFLRSQAVPNPLTWALVRQDSIKIELQRPLRPSFHETAAFKDSLLNATTTTFCLPQHMTNCRVNLRTTLPHPVLS